MRKIYLIILLTLSVSTANAIGRTWNGGTGVGKNWNTNTNWLPVGVPAAGDDFTFNTAGTITFSTMPATVSYNSLTISQGTVILAAGSNMTLTIGGAVATDLTIASAASLTLGTNVSLTMANSGTADISGTLIVNSGRTFNTNGTTVVSTVTGTITNIGTVTNTTASKLLMQTGSTYTHSQNGGTIPTATWTSSTCNITGSTNAAPGALGQAFHHFIWNCAAQSAAVNLTGNLTNVSGNLTISNTNGNDLVLTGNTALTLAIGGDLAIGGATDIADVIVTNGTADPVINISGNLTLQNTGTLLLTNTNDGNVDVDVNVTGNVDISGTAQLNFTSNDANANLDVTGDFSQSGGSVDFSSGGNVTAGNGDGTLNVAGNFLQTAGTIETSTSDADIINGRITFNKAGIQTYSAVPANVTFINFIVANGSTLQLNSNIILTSNATANFGGKFTVNLGGTLDAGTNQVLSSANPGVNNAFTLSSGGRIITANANGIQNAAIGTISTQLATESFSSVADYTFESPVTGTFTTTPTANTIRDMTIDRAAGVTMSQALNVDGVFTLTSGVLNTTTVLLPTISGTGTVTVGSSSTYVNGPIAKTGAGGIIFPVGKSGTYAPIQITAPGAGNTLRAEYKKQTPPNNGNLATGLYKISGCEYWDLDLIGGAPTVNITLFWNGVASPCNGGAAYVVNPASVVIAHNNGTSWDTYGGTGTGTAASGSVTRTGVNVFSPFTLGSTDNLNPLPVKITNITAFEKQQGVQLDWTVVSEENLSKYQVERSADGIRFSGVGEVAARNVSTVSNYGFFDANPLPGVSYYRLRSVDLDGQFAYSSIVRVNLNKGNKEITIYPNPVTDGYVSLQSADLAKGDYTIRIFTVSGQQILNQQFRHIGGAVNQTIQLPSSAKTGMYSLQLVNDGVKVMSKTIIVQ